MVIQQKHQRSSTWVKTLLDAASVNFAHKDFRCESSFEEGENFAKSVIAKIMTDHFGEDRAIHELERLWPQHSYGTLMNNQSLKSERARVKIGLINNYFKFYGK